MGEVYRARDPRLNRLIAIKLLPATAAEDADRRERFEREALALAALNHPGIVTIYSVEEADHQFFLTMELVEGRALADAIPKRGLPLDRVLRICSRVVEAIAAAHQKGIMHRDLKPANIMIGEGEQDGRVKVLDFGLVKLTGSATGTEADTAMATALATGEGRILGTVAYMSPEQAEGKADRRAVRSVLAGRDPVRDGDGRAAVLQLAVGGAWNDDDVIVVGDSRGGLMKCSASGGAPVPVPVTTPSSTSGDEIHIFPSFLPDGKHFLYSRIFRTAPERSGVFMGSLAVDPARQSAIRLVTTGFGAAYVPSRRSTPGHILFMRDGALSAQPFDDGRLEPYGDAVRVAASVGSFQDFAFFSASTTGVLVSRAPQPDVQLTWFERKGRERKRSMYLPGLHGSRAAPDGTRAVVVKHTSQSAADTDAGVRGRFQRRATSEADVRTRAREFSRVDAGQRSHRYSSGGRPAPSFFKRGRAGTLRGRSRFPVRLMGFQPVSRAPRRFCC